MLAYSKSNNVRLMAKSWSGGWRFKPKSVYILDNDKSILQWNSKRKPMTRTRIDLNNVTRITDKTMAKLNKTYENAPLLNINCGLNKDVVFLFTSQEEKNLFWQGIEHFITCTQNKSVKHNEMNQARKLFLKADQDGSNCLDKLETENLLMNLHIKISKAHFEKKFNKYDTDGSHTIEWSEFQQLMTDIMKKEELVEIFTAYCAKAKTLVLHSNPKQMNEMVQNNSQQFDDNDNSDSDIKKNIMTKTEIQSFFLNENQQNLSIDQVSMFVDYFNGNAAESNNVNDNDKISFLTFCNLVFSDFNQAFNVELEQQNETYDRPLTDYYCSTSHNTYLMANQLTGESSVQAYLNAIDLGCRCFELDCWDGPNNTPIIYHGHTLTSKILFQDVIQGLNDNAFVNNANPIVLSLENHCSLLQQDQMANIMRTIFGSRLFTLPQQPDLERYPTLKQLQGKVILKNKGSMFECHQLLYNQPVDFSQKNCAHESNFIVQEDPENEDEKAEENQDFDKFNFNNDDFNEGLVEVHQTNKYNVHMHFQMGGNKQEQNNQFQQQQQALQNNSQQNLEFDFSQEKQNQIQYDQLTNSQQIQSPQQQISQSQSQLQQKSKFQSQPSKKQNDSQEILKIITMFGVKLNLTNGVSSKPRTCWDVSSINEKSISKILSNNAKELVDHHKFTWTRVYPLGTRVDSSNYDPVESFNSGAQLIALNFQTIDMSMLLYIALFSQNGGTRGGYVLKPEFMLHDAQVPRYPDVFINPVLRLDIQVISGQQFQFKYQQQNEGMMSRIKDIVDPYIEIGLRGTAIDQQNNTTFKTNYVEDNGFNPQYNFKCSFNVACPDLCFITFRVFDHDVVSADQLLGWNAFKLNQIRAGYRVVKIRDQNLQFMEGGYILCHFKFTPIEN